MDKFEIGQRVKLLRDYEVITYEWCPAGTIGTIEQTTQTDSGSMYWVHFGKPRKGWRADGCWVCEAHLQVPDTFDELAAITIERRIHLGLRVERDFSFFAVAAALKKEGGVKKDIDVAADMLRKKVEGFKGFITVGIGAHGLIVYTENTKHKWPLTCGGHKVEIVRTTRPKPASV